MGSVKHTSKSSLQYISLEWCLSMYTTVYVTYIIVYTISNSCFCHMAGMHYSIVIINSTSTHMMYKILWTKVSAICGYFYGSEGPKIALEMTLTVKKVLKISKPMKSANWPKFLARYLNFLHLRLLHLNFYQKALYLL